MESSTPRSLGRDDEARCFLQFAMFRFRAPAPPENVERFIWAWTLFVEPGTRSIPLDARLPFAFRNTLKLDYGPLFILRLLNFGEEKQ